MIARFTFHYVSILIYQKSAKSIPVHQFTFHYVSILMYLIDYAQKYVDYLHSIMSLF